MRKTVGFDMGVKAAGNINGFNKAISLLKAMGLCTNNKYWDRKLFRLGVSKSSSIIRY